MKFKKTIDGKVLVLPLNKIVLKKGGKCTYHPSVEQVIADGWVEYSETDEEKLRKAKEKKLGELLKHDESSAVNDCIIVYQDHEFHFWKDKTERDALKGTLRDHITLGIEDFRLDLREHGITITVNCELLLGMMAHLEVYATQCYNKTTDHEFAINACTIEEDVVAYDFRTGYPSIPRFEM